MAADSENLLSKKKGKRTYQNHPKLLLDEKVEVRSVEEGFLGSWHTGTVIRCDYFVREIRYDHLLCDDGSSNLIECVNVSPIIDGIDDLDGIPDSYRGVIRPLPPSLDMDRRSLQYGQCVDMHLDDAWWEGVIFDHEAGSEERNIFFPDMGDEVKANIEKLRITQFWDEITGKWKPRGNWLFLELIEEIRHEWPLLVSVKQIWYEVRLRKGYNHKEWTSSVRDTWRKLISRVLCDNFKLTAKQIFQVFNSSGHLVQEEQPLFELSEANLDGIFKPEALFETSLSILPSDMPNFHKVTSSSVPGQGALLSPPILSILPSNTDQFSNITCNKNDKGSFNKIHKVKLKLLKQRPGLEWFPAGPDMVAEPDFCPHAIIKYCQVSGRRSSIGKLTSKVRAHLVYLGWKIEFARDKGIIRWRYTCPERKYYFSLIQVCRELKDRSGEKSPILEDNQRRLSLYPQDDQRSPLPIAQDKSASSSSPGGLISSSLQKTKRHRDKSDLLSCAYGAIKPEYCPQAVDDYLNGLRRDRALNAKKHLAAVGWSFGFHTKGTNMGIRITKEMRYYSPSGKTFNTLKSACEWYNDESRLSCDDTKTSRERQDMILPESSSGMLLLKDSVHQGKAKVRKKRKLRKTKNAVADVALQADHQNKQEPGPLIADDRDLGSTTRVLRSQKRSREGASPSYQTPRTVLSWLIDNNVVLLGAKVQYRCSKDSRTMGEGRITRDGIKCCCCQSVFSLCNFEAHSDSTHHRPSSNIFLEDGRSLFDCQLQLWRKKKFTSPKTKPRRVKKGNRKCSKNDYICSVCHCGGKLVLCDQCPSSFHTSCLGLKEVPDGDWFCPSCCCGICGESRFDKNTEQLTDTTVHRCTQCERQYHFRCLRDQGLVQGNSYPSGDWFCNIKCEQIFQGLNQLIGKPIPVGVDNLTWTLLKCIKEDGDVHDDLYDELSMEKYSKLSVALSVMHECFEPVREPRTQRDIVEDVIFSRWSELKRLNFQGFYTVLLERNDELITVAAVRVCGEKVAEVPLVATRFQYRRLGMCRVLINELEKKLTELGVERLVLPAVPSVLDTWTTSFGFSKMEESERLNLLDYTFLYFRGTVMCHKLLKDIPSSAMSPSTGAQRKSFDHLVENGNSAVSEVYQTQQVHDRGIVDQESTDGDGGLGTNRNVPSQSANANANAPNEPQLLDRLDEEVKQAENSSSAKGGLKCYKRRKYVQSKNVSKFEDPPAKDIIV